MSRCLSPAAEAHSNLGATLFRKRLLGVNFGDRIPTLSRSFSSEKSYSPSRLMCCQGITEPWATAFEKHLPARGMEGLLARSCRNRNGANERESSTKGSTESLGIL